MDGWKTTLLLGRIYSGAMLVKETFTESRKTHWHFAQRIIRRLLQLLIEVLGQQGLPIHLRSSEGIWTQPTSFIWNTKVFLQEFAFASYTSFVAMAFDKKHIRFCGHIIYGKRTCEFESTGHSRPSNDRLLRLKKNNSVEPSVMETTQGLFSHPSCCNYSSRSLHTAKLTAFPWKEAIWKEKGRLPTCVF